MDEMTPSPPGDERTKESRRQLTADVGALATGLKTTLMEMLQKPVTVQYPEEKSVRSERYRGRHYLRRYDNGLERCIGCELCAAACPVGCILVVAAENTDAPTPPPPAGGGGPEGRRGSAAAGTSPPSASGGRVSPGERYAKVYEINMLRCIFCGYCEEACPVQAIVLGPEYELSDDSREKFIYTKEMLLEPLPPEVEARLRPGQRQADAPPTPPSPARGEEHA